MDNMMRGGSWENIFSEYWSSTRESTGSNYGLSYYGFRIALRRHGVCMLRGESVYGYTDNFLQSSRYWNIMSSSFQDGGFRVARRRA
jgi:hypothetical protein